MNFILRTSGYPVLILILCLMACTGQNETRVELNESETGETKTTLPKNGFNCGFLDSKGILWFGSNGGGVYRYDGKVFTQFTKDDGLSNNKVCAIIEDKEGNLWFGTAKGLSRYDGKSFTTISIPQSDTSSVWLDKVYPIVNPNQVMSILQDKKGIFWIGTNGSGVYRYDPSDSGGKDGGTFTQHWSDVGMAYEDSLQHNIVLDIVEDLSGDIWFSSLSHAGVSRYDGKTFTQYMPEDGLSDDFVRTVFCDRAGNIWVGTHGNRNGGLDKFDGKTFTNFHKTDDGLPQNNIQCVYEDKSGLLWLGAGRGNLSIFDGKHFKEFTSKEGKTYDLIFCIVEDAAGDIWFGGGQGLWRYDGESVIDMI